MTALFLFMKSLVHRFAVLNSKVKLLKIRVFLLAPRSGRPSDDAAHAAVAFRRLDHHCVSCEKPRQHGPRFSGEMRGPTFSPFELHAEHRIGQSVPHHGGRLSRGFVHRTVMTSAPVALMAMVCSKWAERLPSRVTTVQSSSSTRTSRPPSLTIGSMQIAIPGRST